MAAMSGRVAFTMQVRPGQEDEYKARHENVPAALRALFTAVGIRRYSIFMDDTRLFAVLDSNDYENARARMRRDATWLAWQSSMAPLMVEMDDEHATSRFMEEVFYLE